MENSKVQKAIERFKAFEPEQGYYICYSGGKDSDCIRILAELAGVKYDLHYNHTSCEAPETIYYIKSVPGVHIEFPYYPDGKRITMWNLIPKKKMPPTRIVRYCCAMLKERGGEDRFCVTGVRWAESIKRRSHNVFEIKGKPRKHEKLAIKLGLDYSLNKYGEIILNTENDDARRFTEYCKRTSKWILNPIVDWSDSDVWQFLRYYGCSANPLYQCGSCRVGCVGCPLVSAHGMRKEFYRYPKFKDLYIRAFQRMLDINPDVNYSWKSGEEVYSWWVGDDPDQLTLF